jgi:ribonuclease HI
MLNEMKSITVYTDGSCNHAHRTGGWAAILFIENQKFVLKGKELNTTHQRMELTAVLKMLEYVEHNHLLTVPIQVYTDSQYVVNLQKRRANLVGKSFLTKRNLPVANTDLVTKFFTGIDKVTIEFTKVQAHQRVTSGENLNRDVDKLARAEVREYVQTGR